MRHVLFVLALLAAGSSPAGAAPIVSLTGALDPDDANDVLLLELELAAPGDVVIQSWGYGGGVNAAGAIIPDGGFDGYLSMFSGVGAGALFLASDDDSGCPPANGWPCADPRLSFSGLAPGLYTVVLSAFLNMSFAENLGGGTLGDGFIGLGSYYDWRTETDRTSAYALDIDGADVRVTPVPEPSTAALVGAGALACCVAVRRRRACNERRRER